MTIQDQIDQLKKEAEELNEKVNQLHKQFIYEASDRSKPTRYYPNGAYMDEPEDNTRCYFISTFEYDVKDFVWNFKHVENNVIDMNCFPTRESAEKELNRQKLTAKMYRDMRDERINGDWVADWSDDEWKWYPALRDNGQILTQDGSVVNDPHDFYYKNKTFIEDLIALGWTEEELKIVWFRV